MIICGGPHGEDLLRRGMPEDAVSSNLAKYQTRNPVARLLISRFFARLRSTVEPLAPGSVLDAGCGEGEALARLEDILPARVAGVDIDSASVRTAARRVPSAETSQGSVYELDFPDDSFDLVLCLEVLEHLERPADALGELARVARRNVIVSVPHEPYFRAGSLLRGKHLRSFGNHPEHINHWNRESLRALVAPWLKGCEVRTAFPWLLVRGQPSAATSVVGLADLDRAPPRD